MDLETIPGTQGMRYEYILDGLQTHIHAYWQFSVASSQTGMFLGWS